ncbi:MAG: type II secretion system protein [Parcubacteria group bacterium]|nr:type II secretion system protein [Parcubacteria group bacterium]
MNQKKGFTLVELLVVIAIIGLLSTLAVVNIGSARSKARDVRRLSDVQQIGLALELYFADQGVYPEADPAIELGTDSTDILTSEGFEDDDAPTADATVYMGKVPANVDTPDTVGYDYVSEDGTAYAITFELEGPASGLAKGEHVKSPTGVE